MAPPTPAHKRAQALIDRDILNGLTSRYEGELTAAIAANDNAKVNTTLGILEECWKRAEEIHKYYYDAIEDADAKRVEREDIFNRRMTAAARRTEVICL